MSGSAATRRRTAAPSSSRTPKGGTHSLKPLRVDPNVSSGKFTRVRTIRAPFFTDGTGAPDPNPRNLVTWCVGYDLRR